MASRHGQVPTSTSRVLWGGSQDGFTESTAPGLPGREVLRRDDQAGVLGLTEVTSHDIADPITDSYRQNGGPKIALPGYRARQQCTRLDPL
jgi:hypothetical protein